MFVFFFLLLLLLQCFSDFEFLLSFSFFLILLFSIKSHRPNGRISVVKDVNGMLKNKDYLGTSWMILKMPASNQEYQVAVILIRAIKKVAVTFKSTNVLVNTSLFSTILFSRFDRLLTLLFFNIVYFTLNRSSSLNPWCLFKTNFKLHQCTRADRPSCTKNFI